MALTCKWIKDETGALVMKWTGDRDEFSTMKPRMRKLAEFTVIFANNHGNNEAIAKLKSNSPTGAPAYYLSHPAALWLAALEPRPTTRKPPPTSAASGALLTAEQHTR